MMGSQWPHSHPRLPAPRTKGQVSTTCTGLPRGRLCKFALGPTKRDLPNSGGRLERGPQNIQLPVFSLSQPRNTKNCNRTLCMAFYG